MAVIKCKMCGGDIEILPDKTFGICEYCGSTMTLPKIDNEQRAAAFNRGNHFRRIGEFDKAMGVYERIIAEDDTDAEAHWCCALSRFGIEYVEDPETFEWLPTCHRLSFDSFLEDVDYLAAVEHSDGITRRQYQKEAARIALVQRGILATSQNTEPFDVFICYKETDENGERTRDSILAQDIYYQLTEQGRRVFFARITLEEVAGSEYEPYIFAALNSAKVMIVVGTKPENLNAVWVKNEWSRYLSLMKKDRSKLLLPCYRDMDPYDLPEQLSILQSYDMAKIGFIQDLIRGVNKVLDSEKPPEAKETVIVQQSSNVHVDALLKRGQLALEDHDWEKADEFFEEVLNQDAENAQAYIGKSLVDQRCANLEELVSKRIQISEKPGVQSGKDGEYLALVKKCEQQLEQEKKYIPVDEDCISKMSKLAVPGYFEEEDIRNAYSTFDRSYASWVRCRQTQRKGEELWWQKNNLMGKALKFATDDDLKNLDKAMQSVLLKMDQRILYEQGKDNKQAEELRKKYVNFLEETSNVIREKADVAQKKREDDYQRKKEILLSSDDVSSLNEAANFLKSMNYKDSMELSSRCQDKISSLKEEESKRVKRIAEEEKKKAQRKQNRNAIITCCIVIAAMIVMIVIYKVIIPSNDYKRAEALLEAGNYEDARVSFEKLDSYQDSSERVNEIISAEDEKFAKSYEDAENLYLSGDKSASAIAYGSINTYHAKERSSAIWDEIIQRDIISAGDRHSVGLENDGTVIVAGNIGIGDNVSDWTDIVEVSAGENLTVGLKADGTVVAIGGQYYRQDSISDWTGIVEVSAGGGHIVGLKMNGTVVATGDDYHGQVNVSGWRNIVGISAGGRHTVGLKTDGTIVAVGDNTHQQSDVSHLGRAVAISAGGYHTVGLKEDGTVTAIGSNEDGQCDVYSWTDIVAVSAGGDHTVGLKADGTVVAVGDNKFGECDVSSWKDIVMISAGENCTIGLKSDGTVVAAGDKDDGACDLIHYENIKLP